MFCPQCGQQQSSGEVRFCPRCGLSLAGHVALLAAEGGARVPEESAKRAGTRRGAKLMFISIVLFPVFFALCFPMDSPVPLLAPFMVFLTGLVWLVYARLFGDELIHVHRYASRKDIKAGAERPALGGSQFAPAPLFSQQRVNTSEIVQPLSVTENTTSLLDKEV